MRCSSPDSTMTSWPVMPSETEPSATKRGMSDAGRKTLKGGRGYAESRGRGQRQAPHGTEGTGTHSAIGWFWTMQTSSRCCRLNEMSAPGQKRGAGTREGDGQRV